MQSAAQPSAWEAGIAVAAVQGLSAAGVLLARRREAWLRRWLPYVVGVAVGVLLGTAMAHLLPEALQSLGNRPAVWLELTLTVVALFCFERMFHLLSGVRPEPVADLAQQECSEIHAHGHAHGAARPSTLLLGSLTHSLVDGCSIAAAFVVSRRLGWVTALAVALHEVPHRLGDFALLLHMELSQRRAAWLAVGAGLSGVLGWAAVSAIGNVTTARVAWLLPVSAGSFLYISLVDLLPEVFERRAVRESILQAAAIAAGAGLAIGLTRLPGV